MADITVLLVNALNAAGIPNQGVSIGKLDDRTTWRVFFLASATPQQQLQAQAVIDTLDANALTPAEQDKFALAQAQAVTLLNQIAARQTQIASDRTAIANATTLAAVRPVIDNLLAAESIELGALSKLIRVLGWLV